MLFVQRAGSGVLLTLSYLWAKTGNVLIPNFTLFYPAQPRKAWLECLGLGFRHGCFDGFGGGRLVILELNGVQPLGPKSYVIVHRSTRQFNDAVMNHLQHMQKQQSFVIICIR